MRSLFSPAFLRDNLHVMNMGHDAIRPLYISGLICAFFSTLLRAFRWPSDWAEAHWLISYQFGFIKRGLPGTLISPVTGTPDAETAIRLVSASILFIFCVAVFWICLRSISRSKYSPDSVLVVLVFFTSSYIVMSAHVIGYFDQIIILISIGSCWLVLSDRIWSATVLISTGILVHETIFFVGYPSVLFLAISIQSEDNHATTTKILLTTFIRRYRSIVFVPLLFLVAILVFQSVFLNTAEIGMQIASHLESYDFISENRHVYVAYALTASFSKQLMNQSQYFIRRLLNVEFLIMIVIPLSLIYFFCWKRVSKNRHRQVIRLLMFLVVVFPLILHTVAWDTSRIWTYPLIIGLIGMWSVCEIFSGRTGLKHIDYPIVIGSIMVVFLQIFTTTELMDGLEERFSMVERVILYAPSLILIALAAVLQRTSLNARS